jgi:hypothetical protein
MQGIRVGTPGYQQETASLPLLRGVNSVSRLHRIGSGLYLRA